MKTTFIVTILCVMIRLVLELTWTKEELYSTSCEGEDKLLMLNYSIEENEKVVKIQWFFNKTKLICFYSDTRGFIVAPAYEGRVEQRGATGILLKKVSALDAGEYSLYPNLAGEHTQNFQTLFLTVYERPTYQCKPNITVHSKNILSCSTNSCGGQQLLPEWRLFEERDPVGNQSYLKVNSSWNDEFVFCCPQGPNMKCHNGDQLMFCASTSIQGEDIPGSNYGDRRDFNIIIIVVITAGGLLLLMVTFVIIFVLFCHYWKASLQYLGIQRTSQFHEMQNLNESSTESPVRNCGEADDSTSQISVSGHNKCMC